MNEVEQRAAAIVDGIYFDLPAEVYHAVPRLSASALQKLLVSAGTFWRGSWLDPDRPEPDEDSTKAQILGRAYHTARLEPHLFESSYVRALDKAEFPSDTLFTGTEMGAELAAMGLVKSGSVGEQADRLAAAGCAKPLWHIALRQWEEERGDRIPIPANFYDDIVRDMERIRSVPDVAELLQGGAAEVSIFWTDERGMRLKARLDYLKATGWSDLKTFDNSRGKELEQTLVDFFRFNRCHVQAAQYRDAVDAIRSRSITVIEGSAEQRAMIDALVSLREEPACWYIFVEKNGVPNVLARRCEFDEVPLNVRAQHAGAGAEGIARVEALTRQPQLWFTKAQREVSKAKRRFRTYSEVYQPGEAWLPFQPLGAFNDMSFNAYWLDEEIGE